LHENPKSASGFNLICPVQICRKKYSAFNFPKWMPTLPPSRLIGRGVRVVTIRGVRDAVDAGSVARDGQSQGGFMP
jgi:hypothetical protein